MNDHIYTRNGTLGGTFLSLLANINGSELVKTVVYAAVGAIVSYGVSVLLRYIKKLPKE